METCINYCEPGYAYMSTDERRWITHLKKLAKDRPEEMIIIKYPEENNGVLYCKFPQKWARVSPPRQVVISDEKRADLLQNIELARETKARKRQERMSANDQN